MTDLCMEPEAEQMCEKLIAEALLLDDNVAESWSILGSIRISQIRNDEARQALEKSWSLFENGLVQNELSPASIPAIIRLAQSMIELEMAEPVLDLTTQLTRVDDQIPDMYYLNALAHHQLLQTADNESDLIRHNVAIRDAVDLMSRLDEPVDPELLEAGQQLVAGLPEVSIELPDSDDEPIEE